MARKKMSQQIFIKKAREKHNNKYDYSMTTYTSSGEKIQYNCPIHGVQNQRACAHLIHGCSFCGRAKQRITMRLTKEEFISKCTLVYGDVYDYFKVNYTGNDKKVEIVCKEHGSFLVVARSFQRGNSRCPGCTKELRQKYRTYTTEQFIEKAIKVHDNKFSYERVEYKNINEKVELFCNTCNTYIWQPPTLHLQGYGCKNCWYTGFGARTKSNTQEFIEKTKSIHGEKYDYSKVDYQNNTKKVIIICPEHGEFLQSPMGHLFGNGCSECHESKLERTTKLILEKHNKSFTRQWYSEKCKDTTYLKFDFSVATNDMFFLIECQGEQHYNAIDHFGGLEGFLDRQKKDKIKEDYCIQENIPLLKIPYWLKNTEIENFILDFISNLD